jgi:hypothetical protein
MGGGTMGRKYRSRDVVKEAIALGIGGQILIEDGMEKPPPNGRVRFEAWADFENEKYHFNEDETVDYLLILTIDKNTFKILETAEPLPKPQQEELAMQGPEEGDGPEE